MAPFESDNPQPRVFVSRPSVVTQAQRDVEQTWLTGLSGLGLTTVTMSRDSYSSEPWGALRHAVATADGTLILGFRQARIDQAEWRPDTAEAGEYNRWSATPWNQIEGGLAVMADLPVLTAPEEGIAEGVFADDVRSSRVQAVPIDIWRTHSEPAAHPVIKAWVLAVCQHAGGQAVGPSG